MRRVLDVATVVCSAFLLFSVQPMIARSLLPWFGGAAVVWGTCLVVFQSLLVLGYGYATWLSGRDVPAQRRVHTLLLLAALPVLLVPLWPPSPDVAPVPAVIVRLLATVGLPYVVLSTTAPLVQAWRGDDPRAWRLYAASNVGSLGALLVYPSWIERTLPVSSQHVVWRVGFVLYVGLALLRLWTGARRVDRAPDAVRVEPAWVLLPVCSSVLLLGVTEHLTADVAAVPFLWVLPLSVYLLSYVLVFRWPAATAGPGWRVAAALAAVGMTAGLELRWEDGGLSDGIMPLGQALGLYLGGLLVLCTALHGALAATRPATSGATSFYLASAVGGALGSMLVVFLAPVLLPAAWELGGALVLVATLAALGTTGVVRATVQAAALVSAVFVFRHLLADLEDTQVLDRNVYGSVRVKVVGRGRERVARMMHGQILHGAQYTDEDRRHEPVSYYGPTSGVVSALSAVRASRGRPLRIGIIGLGSGALAGWGQAGDVIRYYELDPKIEPLARAWFSWLDDSAATVDVTLGDARRTLELSAPQAFDVLVLDAFSGDAIPVHLLTAEATTLWSRHLAVDGALVVHISNRFVDLEPVAAGMAGPLDAFAVRVDDEPPEDAWELSRSTWVVITSSLPVAEAVVAHPGAEELVGTPARWTDDLVDLPSLWK